MTMTPAAPENVILGADGNVYLVTGDTVARIGHWTPRPSWENSHVAYIGPDSKRISARHPENLKQLIADECC